MLFNSFAFIFLFLPATILLYYLLCSKASPKAAARFLVVASLVFYSYWDIRNLPLLIGSILFNYYIGSKLSEQPSKALLTGGVAVNLALLGFFKYTGFFLSSLNEVVGSNIAIPHIVLPLGISFFTFTQIAYLVDAYRGETTKYNFSIYALFVTIFPHLIAGPILYHKDMIPQFVDSKKFAFLSRNVSLGLAIFALGLFKKVMIADTLAPWVQVTFDHADKVTFLEAWQGALAYTFQLYFDFSGYSEMALGLGKMFNFDLPINFRSPYKATSIIDFWRRWHITLSAFLKNYLYISLGGNRYGTFNRYRNLMITMLLGGLWHGAGWTFVVWGGLHGLYLVVNHCWRLVKIELPKPVAWVITFLAVVVAWVFFRAATVHDAVLLLKAMGGLNGVVLSYKSEAMFSFLKPYGVTFSDLKYPDHALDKLGILVVAAIIMLKIKSVPEYAASFKPNILWALLVIALLTVAIGSLTTVTEFLYFQF